MPHCPSPAHAADITLSANVVGKTPEIVGYNSGHFMAASNTAAWWRYTEANGARVWSTPSTVEGNDDNSVWGDGVGSEAQFISRRAALRANPTSTTYINWPYLENRYQNVPTSGSNNINLAYAFGELHARGVEPVVEMHRTSERYPFDPAGTAAGWADRWEQWQHFYAQAFYLAKNFDVRRFQMYNEPNHSSNDVSQDEYIERLRLASDAVQSAVADVNAVFGKSLDVQMHAPVTAGGAAIFNQRPGGDPRDDQVGWGELVIDNLHTNYLGQVDPNFQLIDTYAVQLYNMNGPGFASEIQTVKNLVNAASGGAPIRFAITEFGVHTAAVFENTSETMDSPSKFSTLGSILANLANAKVEELYLQKFSLTADDSASGVKKNGLHYVDNNTAPYDVGGITKGGEVSRLFNKGFAGGHDLLAKPVVVGTAVNVLHVAASYDLHQRRHSIFSANTGATAQDLTLDLNRLGIAPGTIVTVEEVSADRQGEVRQLVEVPASGQLSLNQPRESVFLITAPDEPPAYRVTLAATDDAVVRPRRQANYNFGSEPTLFAENDSTLPESRGVTFLKFDLDGISASSVEQAVLRVSGANAGSADQVIAHVYAISSDAWDESSITWGYGP
ncbi:MAG TPA: DNRLRE domain-containing protein [Lacipirellula sp.]